MDEKTFDLIKAIENDAKKKKSKLTKARTVTIYSDGSIGVVLCDPKNPDETSRFEYTIENGKVRGLAIFEIMLKNSKFPHGKVYDLITGKEDTL